MKILIGCPVRQDEITFKLYLDSLRNLNTEGHEVHFFFVLHNSPQLKPYLLKHEYTEYTTNDDYKKDDQTHHWTNLNLYHVAKIKNIFMDMLANQQYDYFLMVDSDLLLHPNTLQHLIQQRKDIIAEVFWTKWQQGTEPGPNAWDFDFYNFKDTNRTDQWKRKGVYEVGGTGACILISKKVAKAGVNYNPIENVSFSNWEDRAFCIRANVNGFKIYLDTHYPAKHLYRESDVLEVLANVQSNN